MKYFANNLRQMQYVYQVKLITLSFSLCTKRTNSVKWSCFLPASPQNGVEALRKAHTHSIRSLSVPSQLPSKQFQCWSGWTSIISDFEGWDVSHFFSPLLLIQVMNDVKFWPFHVQNVPETSQHFCLPKLIGWLYSLLYLPLYVPVHSHCFFSVYLILKGGGIVSVLCTFPSLHGNGSSLLRETAFRWPCSCGDACRDCVLCSCHSIIVVHIVVSHCDLSLSLSLSLSHTHTHTLCPLHTLSSYKHTLFCSCILSLSPPRNEHLSKCKRNTFYITEIDMRWN